MIKRKLKQIFIIFLTTLTCTMGICSTVAGANNQEIVEEYVVIEDGIEKHVTVTETGVADIEADFGLGELLDGLVGVVFWVVKLIPMTIARLFMSLVSLAINGTEGFVSGFTLDKVLFNEIPLLQVNFFQMPEADAFNSEMITSLRKNVSIWYVSIRNLAAVILAIMALYVGIRMAISSVAEEKAKYKKMLVDWVVSLGLLFVLHYIMVFVVEINDSIVEVLRNIRDNTLGDINAESWTDKSSLMDKIWSDAFTTVSLIEQLSYMFIYCTLAVMTFIFFITYVKRMITIAFLIMIAPIITITYSIDRMGDGKSQALNKWFKEYIYNILLQPFQCVIYLALVNSAIASLAEEVTLASGLIAGLMVVFMYQAENIIKEIFHFESKSVASTIAQTALVTSAIGLIGSGAKKAGKAASSGGGRKKTQPKQKDPAAGGAGAGSGANGGSGTGSGGNSGSGSGSGNGSSAGNGSRGSSNAGAGSGSGAGGTSGNGKKPGLLKELGSMAGHAALDIGKRAGKGAIKGVAKLPLAMMMMSAGAATGNLTNAINGFKSGSGMTEDFINRRAEKWHSSDVATDYQRAMDSGLYAGKSDAEIRQRTKDLLEGEAEPVSDKEREYYSAMVKTKDYYKDRGYSEDEAISRIDEDIAGFQSGTLGEVTAERVVYNHVRNSKPVVAAEKAYYKGKNKIQQVREERERQRNGSSGEDNKFGE